METILVGSTGSVEHIEAHPLLNTIDRCLARLVNDNKSTPQNIVDALWYTAAIFDKMGPPVYIVKDGQYGNL